MIRFASLQFRIQVAVAFGALAVMAVILGVTGPHLVHLYDTTVATCGAHGNCSSATAAFLSSYPSLQDLGNVVIVVPAIIGIFWGAPLVARELETGTHRLVWTQSVTRTRWIAVKLGLVGLASMAVAGLFSLMMTWWSSPIDRVNMSQFPVFAERGFVPIGYAAFRSCRGHGWSGDPSDAACDGDCACRVRRRPSDGDVWGAAQPRSPCASDLSAPSDLGHGIQPIERRTSHVDRRPPRRLGLLRSDRRPGWSRSWRELPQSGRLPPEQGRSCLHRQASGSPGVPTRRSLLDVPVVRDGNIRLCGRSTELVLPVVGPSPCRLTRREPDANGTVSGTLATLWSEPIAFGGG